MKMFSMQRPLPSMEMATPAFLSRNALRIGGANSPKCSRNGCLTVNAPSWDAHCASMKSSNSLTRHAGLQR